MLDLTIKIQLAFELLPAVTDGSLHAVDPDPDKMFEDYAVSLCGRALKARGAHVDSWEECDTCVAVAGERQAEFDAEGEL